MKIISGSILIVNQYSASFVTRNQKILWGASEVKNLTWQIYLMRNDSNYILNQLQTKSKITVINLYICCAFCLFYITTEFLLYIDLRPRFTSSELNYQTVTSFQTNSGQNVGMEFAWSLSREFETDCKLLNNHQSMAIM